MARRFDLDRVTRSFYDRFKAVHERFAAAIEGIPESVDRACYASVMLNRLMFLFFIQTKGFLDGDQRYLQQRLDRHWNVGQTGSFYRRFLLPLCHEGLSRPGPHPPQLRRLLGEVPHLNGGLFEPHPLERSCPAIEIPDEAMAAVFEFLTGYDWVLDDRPLVHGREINPDVLGYIFEKYINDHEETGAYYTKEDITDYIGKNAIIPYLLEAVHQARPVIFGEQGLAVALLREDPDAYIYAEARTGLGDPLPGLPGETGREYLARIRRVEETRRHLRYEPIDSADALVARNVDLRRLARHLVERCDDPDLLLTIYERLSGITVLDPTCGSGAFLFAALRILAPLYAAALDRMAALAGGASACDDRPAIARFREVLAEVRAHPNRAYFVHQAIMRRNLYGVDLMAEAAEICKLRLVLKLAAQLDGAGQMPPLPQTDVNIRAGNALTGFDWAAQWPGIVPAGGFDVIIGNPPYVEAKHVTSYQVTGYETLACGDLYAYTLERALGLLRRGGWLGFIVPLSAFTVDRFRPLQALCFRETDRLLLSYWSGDAHPAKLFEGVDKRLIIMLGRRSAGGRAQIYTSRYYKWYASERPFLFNVFPQYLPVSMPEQAVFPTSVPKVSTAVEMGILAKLKQAAGTVGSLVAKSGTVPLYYTRKVSFFLQFLDFVPEVLDARGEGREPSELKTLHFAVQADRNLALACLSSSLFYWYFIANSDCRNLNRREVVSFPVPDRVPREGHDRIAGILSRLMADYKANASPRTVNYAQVGAVTVPYFNFRVSKPIIDELDRLLAPYYGLAGEELEFVIHYDEKYRMGGGDEK